MPIIDMKEMGIGLAAAVLIDATIVRAVLLPGDDEAARRVELVPADAGSSGCPGSSTSGRQTRASHPKEAPPDRPIEQRVVPDAARKGGVLSGARRVRRLLR